MRETAPPIYEMDGDVVPPDDADPEAVFSNPNTQEGKVLLVEYMLDRAIADADAAGTREVTIDGEPVGHWIVEQVNRLQLQLEDRARLAERLFTILKEYTQAYEAMRNAAGEDDGSPDEDDLDALTRQLPPSDRA